MGGGQEYQAPDYSAANREAVISSTQSLPIIQKINNAAQLGTVAELSANELATLGLDPSKYKQGASGNYEYADFTGQGADVLASQQTSAYLKSLETTTPELLKIQEQYGTDFATAARAANEAANPEQYAAMEKQASELEANKFATAAYTEDPTERALREDMTSRMAADVALGSSLNTDQAKLVEQQARRAQLARGNVYGVAPAVEETMKALDYGTTLENQRRQAAQQWLQSGQNVSAYDFAAKQAEANSQNQSYGNYINALQNFQTSTPSTQSTVQSSAQGSQAQQQNLNPSNIASTAGSIFGTNAGMYNSAQQNNVSPFAAAVGMGTSAFSAIKPFGI